jgi:hypothetical protein
MLLIRAAASGPTCDLMQAFIATLADGSGYVLMVEGKAVSTHATIAEAVKARNELEAETEAQSA